MNDTFSAVGFIPDAAVFNGGLGQMIEVLRRDALRGIADVIEIGNPVMVTLELSEYPDKMRGGTDVVCTAHIKEPERVVVEPPDRRQPFIPPTSKFSHRLKYAWQYLRGRNFIPPPPVIHRKEV